MVRTDVEQRPKGIEVILGPHNRPQYLADQLRMDALDGLTEDPLAAYCAVSLTNTPELAKPYVEKSQDSIKQLLAEAGISSYDPYTSPFSPDRSTMHGPGVIYRTDIARVAGARFFTASDTFPSTGMGVELEAARRYNRIPVIFHADAIRTSRMQPDCAIHVNLTDIEAQREQVVSMFNFLKTFEPGRGLVEGQPALLGFKNGKPHDLTKEVEDKFPELAYTYDGQKPPLKFTLENHGVLFKVEPK